jgi:hypothetical protein
MSIPIVTPDCADGANARIQLIDGVELVQAKPVLTVQLDSPDACLHICRLNAVSSLGYEVANINYNIFIEMIIAP